MIYYVLLVYGDKYYENAINKLKDISKKIGDRSFNLIVVNNDSTVYIPNSITGDNSAYEFSGWDSAVKDLKYRINEGDYFIFANDTFCHHRKWKWYQKFKFSYAFNDFFKNKFNGICGDVNSFGKDFNLSGVVTQSWVSSYLFMINSSLILHESFKFDSIEDNISKYVENISDESGIEFVDNFDDELGKHLNNWLYPRDNDGWYNAKNCSSKDKLKKLKSIINEKLLSINVLKLGGNICDVNSLKIFRIIGIIKKILFKVV
ncbi:hypothetical protein [Acinetobacter pollinis]|uniref:Uncharacterized protein n=1 Tax=Acinetobacter pollinis TaxID=2605270 RepID=A0ABU6DSI5_9GAMM|nr:hypothetical protein [Acinetobacter pollinis]MEB5476806.1 hypothetical protein [Acinetobacter pollinis]